MTTGFITHTACLAHEMGRGHPESPARLMAINDHLAAVGLLDQLVQIEAPAVTRDAVLLAHSEQHWHELQSAAPNDGYRALDPDTTMNPFSWDAALRAAGAVVNAVDRVMAGQINNAFCAVRPPGHHARPGQAMGFCFFNNIAIGALHALTVHSIERVAIVDFDVHHGNGTEEIFAGDERALMVSFFQHPFYPFSGTVNPAKNMVNVPLAAGANGSVMRQAIEKRWWPALEAFKPQLIFISAGFDAHRDDSLGQMALVESDYYGLTEQLMEVAKRHAGGRLISSLEGGYNVSALATSVAAHIQALIHHAAD